jgi:hypothetical protein
MYTARRYDTYFYKENIRIVKIRTKGKRKGGE